MEDFRQGEGGISELWEGDSLQHASGRRGRNDSTRPPVRFPPHSQSPPILLLGTFLNFWWILFSRFNSELHAIAFQFKVFITYPLSDAISRWPILCRNSTSPNCRKCRLRRSSDYLSWPGHWKRTCKTRIWAKTQGTSGLVDLLNVKFRSNSWWSW